MLIWLLIAVSIVMGTIVGRVGMKVLTEWVDLPAGSDKERNREGIYRTSSTGGVLVSLFLVSISTLCHAPGLAVMSALFGGLAVPLLVCAFSVFLYLEQLLPRLYSRAMARIDRAYDQVMNSFETDDSRERLKTFMKWSEIVNSKGWDSKEAEEFLARHSDDEELQEFAVMYKKKMQRILAEKQSQSEGKS